MQMALKLLLASLFLCAPLFSWSSTVAAPLPPQAPIEVAPEPGPAKAAISLYVFSISKLDMKAMSFDATFYLYITCPPVVPCSQDGWELVNGKVNGKVLQTTTATLKQWRVEASLSFNGAFHSYPFDSQTLPVVIEDGTAASDKLVYVPDPGRSGVDPQVVIPGWTIGQFSFTESAHSYVPLEETYSQVGFSVPISKSPIASVAKFYVPLTIIVLLGVSTLVLARNDMQLRTGGTALLGLTLFYLAATTVIPAVGYSTIWDESVVLCYALLFMVLACGVVGSYMHGQGKFEGDEGTRRNKRLRSRFAIAIGVVALVGAIAIAFI